MAPDTTLKYAHKDIQAYRKALSRWQDKCKRLEQELAELAELAEALHLILVKQESYDTEDEVLGQIFAIAGEALDKG